MPRAHEWADWYAWGPEFKPCEGSPVYTVRGQSEADARKSHRSCGRL